MSILVLGKLKQDVDFIARLNLDGTVRIDELLNRNDPSDL